MIPTVLELSQYSGVVRCYWANWQKPNSGLKIIMTDSFHFNLATTHVKQKVKAESGYQANHMLFGLQKKLFFFRFQMKSDTLMRSVIILLSSVSVTI